MFDEGINPFVCAVLSIEGEGEACAGKCNAFIFGRHELEASGW